MTQSERVTAIVKVGFTERQARFLVLVMQHSGVCLLRQYTAFAGIVHGQKTRNLFAKLVSRRFATAYSCRHNRGHVFHVHHKALYRAIGETDSRHRRPLSPDRIIQGLATLDALLVTPTTEYLPTADDKTQRLSIEAHLFKDKHPVGVDPNGRFVLLYVTTEACSSRFVAFLQRQRALLRSVPAWTLRIVVPSWPQGLDKTYLKVAHTELAQLVTLRNLDVLRTYFEQRRAPLKAEAREQAAFERARRAFRGERFEVLYGRWLTEGEAALEGASSADLGQAIKDGTGRIESLVLPHQYRHLSLFLLCGDHSSSRTRPCSVRSRRSDHPAAGAGSSRAKEPAEAAPQIVS